MRPYFTTFLISGIALSLVVLALFVLRFGLIRTVAFGIVAGLFPAIMEFISSFAASNYEYPGQSRLWVFAYIFFGWISVCGTCLLIAEGILAPPRQDLLTTPRLRWAAPLLAGAIAVILDLFIDPIAVVAGYWVWLVPANVYYEIPLLNFVGWFVLMFLAPLAWIKIARHPAWGIGRTLAASIAALPLLCAASIAMSLVLNAAFAAAGLQ